MRIVWLSLFIGFLWVSTAFGQRDAPVWESYLPSVSIYHDGGNRDGAITVDFLFKKNGGPHEHTEHQAYVLLYLKEDEEQIMKLAGDSQLVRKKNEKAKLFLDVLVEKKLVAPLGSQVAKLNSRHGSNRRFADVRGYPRRAGVDSLAAFSFPFKFTFTYETLFQSARKLGNFRPEKVMAEGKSTWFDDKFKLMVFVPVNDSAHATKVSRNLREIHDFASVMDVETSLLYFRPLPYELGFKKYGEDALLIYIN
jgi:hypothetical protein